jgi:tetratricopeptide (TPR) repeat protein
MLSGCIEKLLPCPKPTPNMTRILFTFLILACVIQKSWAQTDMGNNSSTASATMPVSPSTAANEERDLYYKKGTEKLVSGDYNIARAYFTLALESDPNYVAAMGGMAKAENALGEHSNAIQYCDNALAKDARNADALLQRALARNKIGEYAKALLDCDLVLKLAPERKKEALMQKSIALYKNKDYNKALIAIDELIEIDGKSAEAYYHKSNIELAIGDQKMAIESLKKAADLDTKYQAAYQAATTERATASATVNFTAPAASKENSAAAPATTTAATPPAETITWNTVGGMSMRCCNHTTNK